MKSLVAVLLVLLIFGAGCGGTETGNPSGLTTTAGGSAGAGTGESPYTATPQNLVNAICALVAQCDGADSSACLSGILSQTNIPTALGLSASFGTVQQMLSEYNSGTISENTTYSNQCLTDIEALSCSSSAVTSAYSSSAPTDWTKLINLIPTSSTSCAGVF
jgi:hypothetical protein